jgi:uncharacterized protein YndB with AHSA1/START domain
VTSSTGQVVRNFLFGFIAFCVIDHLHAECADVNGTRFGQSSDIVRAMATYPQFSSASIEVDAPPDVVWRLVADITRMGEWSPECYRAEWEGGSDAPEVGAHFHGYNRAGTFEWDAPCVVTECEPGRLFAFAVPRNSPDVNIWRFEFTPNGSGTVLKESFDAPLINVDGSPANFEGRFEMLAEAIKKTIANIKAAAEAS